MVLVVGLEWGIVKLVWSFHTSLGISFRDGALSMIVALAKWKSANLRFYGVDSSNSNRPLRRFKRSVTSIRSKDLGPMAQ